MLLKNNYYEKWKFDSVVVILIWSCISLFSRSPRFKSCSNPLKEINKWKGMYSLLLMTPTGLPLNWRSSDKNPSYILQYKLYLWPPNKIAWERSYKAVQPNEMQAKRRREEKSKPRMIVIWFQLGWRGKYLVLSHDAQI